MILISSRYTHTALDTNYLSMHANIHHGGGKTGQRKTTACDPWSFWGRITSKEEIAALARNRYAKDFSTMESPSASYLDEYR